MKGAEPMRSTARGAPDSIELVAGLGSGDRLLLQRGDCNITMHKTVVRPEGCEDIADRCEWVVSCTLKVKQPTRAHRASSFTRVGALPSEMRFTMYPGNLYYE